MLSSVMKQMGEAVETVVKDDKDGKFTNTPVRRHPGERRRAAGSVPRPGLCRFRPN